MADNNSETNIPIGDWTTGSLKVYHDDKIAALKELTDQRFADNYIALIAALTAQEKAVAAALKATQEAIAKAEESNEKRFQAQEKAVATAFNASNEAIAKSELAVEKRADVVYVTIAKLQEALASIMPRSEAEQRFTGLAEKVADLATRSTSSEGEKKGSDVTVGKIYAAIGVVGAVLGIIILLANGVF